MASRSLRSLLAILMFITLVSFNDVVTKVYSQPTFVLVRRVHEGFEKGFGIFQANPSGTAGAKITSLYKHSGNSSLLVNVTGDVAYATTNFQTTKTSFRIEFFVFPISKASTGNLPVARIFVLSEPSVTISMWLNDSELVVIIDGVDLTKEIGSVKYNEWTSISLAYDPHDGELDVNVGSVTVASASLPGTPDSGVKVELGIFDLSGSDGGSLAYDDVSLYLSPLILVDPPLANIGDTVIINGFYFTPGGTVSVEVTSETGLVSSYDLKADDAGGFSTSLKLEGLSVGLFNVIATDLASGTKVTFHFGVWGLSSDEIRKVRPFYAFGVGLMPNSQLKITLISKGLKIQEAIVSADGEGKFRSPDVSIPAGAPLGTYELRIEGMSTYDLKNRRFEDRLEFTPKGAIINVKITTDSEVYDRLQDLKVTVSGTYENGSSVPYSPSNTVLLTLKNETHAILLKRSMSYDILLKSWAYSYLLPENLALGNYTVEVEFCDPYGNSGKSGVSIVVMAGYLKVNLSGVERGGSYERTVVLNISAVVLYTERRSVDSGSFRAIFVSPYESSVLNLKYDNSTSSWVGSFTIRKDEALGRFVLLINGTDDYGNIADYSTWFFVSSAKLDLTPKGDLPPEIQRTQPVELKFQVRYPSGESLSEGDNVSLLLYNPSDNASFEWKMVPVKNPASGELMWTASGFKFPADAPLGLYLANVTAFDAYGNEGSYYFNLSLIPANLRLNFSASKYDFQVGFEQVIISGKVFYRDNTELEEGNVSATIKVNSYLRPLVFSYGKDREWVMTLVTSPLDPSGTYTVHVTAEDRYGNFGDADLELVGSQLFVTISIILIVASVGTVLALLFRNIRRSRRATPPSDSQVFGQV